jgi:ABC-type lipoprotein export system ATPase subunit
MTSAYVMTSIEDLHASGLTVIAITHDLAVAERAKRVITIRDGRIITDRRTSE